MASLPPYGGWADNPATGKNQRYWGNGVWTDGAEPNQNSSQNSNQNSGNSTSPNIEDAINQYSDLVIKQSQGDYDYAAKYIEAQYKQALGSDDKQAQDFLKKVSNSLEEKVGRIVYDYQTNTYRHEQDVKIATDRTGQGRDLALKRLAEDEQVLKEQAIKENEIAREEQGTSLNARGILSTTRENADGLAGKEVGRLEEGIQERMSALERAGLRSKDDINLNANQSLEDLALADQRGKEDLTTGGRRAGQDAVLNKDQSLEEAKRRLERAKEAEEANRRQKLYNWASIEDIERQKSL